MNNLIFLMSVKFRVKKGEHFVCRVKVVLCHGFLSIFCEYFLPHNIISHFVNSQCSYCTFSCSSHLCKLLYNVHELLDTFTW